MNRREFLRAAGAGAAATIALPAAAAKVMTELTERQVDLILPKEPKIILPGSMFVFNMDEHAVKEARYSIRGHERVFPIPDSIYSNVQFGCEEQRIEVTYYPTDHDTYVKFMSSERVRFIWPTNQVDEQILITDFETVSQHAADILIRFEGVVVAPI